MRKLIGVLVFLISSQCFAIELYFEAAERCEKGGVEMCKLLAYTCDVKNDARACFHLSYSIGMLGDDEAAMAYLKKACIKGIDDACAYSPIIRRELEEKNSRESVKL